MNSLSFWHYYLGLSTIWWGLAWAVSAYLTGYVAQQKQYPFGIWLIGGALFPGITLLAAVGLPDRFWRQQPSLQSKPSQKPYNTPASKHKNEHYISTPPK